MSKLIKLSNGTENLYPKEWELLWTGVPSTNDFPAQTISLDLTDFQFAIILFKHYKGFGPTDNNPAVLTVKDYSVNLFSVSGSNGPHSGALQVAIRAVSTSASGISFGDGYVSNQGGAYSANDGVLVPIKIFGVR